MEKITLTRDQLYDLIWSKPATALAKEFGLSDNGLRKICKKFNIPLPYLGYWAKLKHGKIARKVNLPTKFEGKDEILIEPLEIREAIQKAFSSKTILIKQIETNHKHLLEVPARLSNPDALIVKTKDALMENKNYRIDNGLIVQHGGIMNIKVAPINVPRALRFMDTLIKLLKARGYEIIVGHDETHVVVFGEKLVIRLQEKLRFEDVIEGLYNWKTRRYYPTGIFMLRCWKSFHWDQRVWIDGKVLIEKQLAKIMAGIELLAEKERKERLENEEYWRIQKEKQRIEKERHDREELDGANFQKLLAQSKIWKQSQILNEYISEIETRLISKGELEEEAKEWLVWAKTKAEKFNPLINLSF